MADTRVASGVIENTGFIGLFAAVGVALESYVPANWHGVLAIAAPILGKYAQMLTARYLGGNLLEKAGPLVLAVLAFGLAAPSPSHAGTDPSIPPIGCGGGACNFYLVSGGWSPHSKQVFVGGNAVDFLSGSFGVGMFGASAHGDMNFIGGVCAIPRVKDALAFICPPTAVQ